MPPSVTALRYMTRFQCIADKCEDTCCAGMKIMLTEADRDRMLKAMGGTEAGKAEVMASIEEQPDLGAPYFAVLKHNESKRCRFLDGANLCTVHKQHGIEALGDICATFPRTRHMAPGNRIQVTGAMGCPEVVRLALLADDALDLVAGDAQLVDRVKPSLPDEYPYGLLLDTVVAAGRKVLEQRSVSLAARVLLLGELGRRVDEFFNPWAEKVDEARLRQELEKVQSPLLASELESRLKQAQLPSGDTLDIVVSLLATIPPGAPPRSQLVAVTLHHYLLAAKGANPALGTKGGPPFWDTVLETFRRQRARTSAALKGAMEQWLERFLVHDWYHEWYTYSPSLSAHAFKMAVRLSAVQVLLSGHPTMWTDPITTEGAQKALVEAVQTYARYVERNPDVFPTLERSFAPDKLGTDAFGRVERFAALAHY
jgi:lysine-N-methylase